MTDKEILARLERLEELMRQAKEGVIRLEAKVGLGPGQTPSDQELARRVEKIADRLQVLERKMWYMVGAAALAVMLARMIGQALVPVFQHIQP